MQYLRVFKRGTNLYRLTILLVVISALWGTAFNILAWFPCAPITDYWSLQPDPHCWGFGSPNPSSFATTYTAHSASNMVIDMVLLILPLGLFFGSEVTRKVKYGLLGILSLGIL